MANENKPEMNRRENEELMPKARAAREVFDWVQTFCQALFVVVILFTFVFRFVTVDGTSMTDTLSHGDRLIISDVGYTAQRGDVVVVHDLESEVIHPVTRERLPAFKGPIIKRVIATEGETVLIDYDNWTITVTDLEGNTFTLEEPYVKYIEGVNLDVPNSYSYPQSVGNKEKHVVKEGHVFVCGDNRSNSLDSRWVGDIDERKILGKVLVRVFPNPQIMKHIDY